MADVIELSTSGESLPADEKKVPVEESSDDVEGVEQGDDEIIHHPANQDDILTHTIHVQDDPTLNWFTFRTWFLGKKLTSSQLKHAC